MDTSAEVTPTPKISVIDDDDGMRDAIIAMLELQNYEFEAFRGAAAFLASYGDRARHCIISDMRMPGVDGIELQRRLRDMGADVPIVFVTSYDCDRTSARALAAGAVSVLRKPVTAADLTAALHVALGIGGDGPVNGAG